MTVLPEAITAASSVFSVHRWKSMGVDSVECECGAVVHGESVAAGPSFDPDGPGYESAKFPADEAFRRHLANSALEAAAPLIAAAERARIRQLAIDHSAWIGSPDGCADPECESCSARPIAGLFADLLGGDL